MRPTRWCARVAPSGSASPASRGWSPSRTPRATAMRSACPLPQGLPEALLEPAAAGPARSRLALRPHARPVHHRRPGRALRAGPIDAPTSRSGRCTPRDACSRASSARAASTRSGARARSSRPSGGARSPSSGTRSSPSSCRCWAASLTQWQGVTRPRRGLDALLDVVETLQGLPLAASILEREILPARLERYQPSDLDALISAGEVVWTGVEPLGERDGRIALFLTDHVASLWRGVIQPPALDDLSAARTSHPRRPGHSGVRSSSARCTTRPAVASRRRPWTRSGRWSGGG